MAFPLTLPAIGSTNWGTAVNGNWTTLNNAFQTQANFTGTTSASSSITGSLIVGNGVTSTSVGIGGGLINAGSYITAAYYVASATDSTTTSGTSLLGMNCTLYVSPSASSTATYYTNQFTGTGNSTNLSGAVIVSVQTNAVMTQSTSCTLGTLYGINTDLDVLNTGSGTVSVTTIYGITITPNLSAVSGAIASVGTYIALVLNSPQKSGVGGPNCTIGTTIGIQQEDPAANNTFAGKIIVGTDPGGSDPIRINGALTISDSKLLTTKTNFTNGAGSGAGSLTNAPAAGNPTKWIPINDNGTTRYIPAW